MDDALLVGRRDYWSKLSVTPCSTEIDLNQAFHWTALETGITIASKIFTLQVAPPLLSALSHWHFLSSTHSLCANYEP